MDDAAGLQIATRLKSQTSGMAVAMRNTQNSVSMLQTAEGALDEVTNILTRMKDLATQAADASSSTDDQTAMQIGIRLADRRTEQHPSATPSSAAPTAVDHRQARASITFQIGADSSAKPCRNLST
jgi:flagellin